MHSPRRILVFPCGSEIGLEIHRSLQYSTHFDLIGGSSVEDHGHFVFDEYIGDLPFHNTPDFLNRINEVVHTHRIDAIYPAMDAVANTLQGLSEKLNCRIIGSDKNATAICASKRATYDFLDGIVPLPRNYSSIETAKYPIFIKPDQGYGGRNCCKANNPDAAAQFMSNNSTQSMLLLEYLPGREWTIDCFTDRHGDLRFHAPRERKRISNGISVKTIPSTEFSSDFGKWAQSINQALRPRGAWFFQAREDAEGRPRLLEVAARLGGSSGIFRCQGINFALLSAFDAFDQDVSIALNTYAIELDRALNNKYRLDINYRHIFIDLDDCLIIRGGINHQLIGFVFKSISEGKTINLLTRHSKNLQETLKKYRIEHIFDKIIHLKSNEKKSDFIEDKDAIFIDDSFKEREDVAKNNHIPVFSPDMIEALY